MELTFESAGTDKAIREVFEYNIDAFIDSPDFNWTLEELKNEIKDGWELYSVKFQGEVIAAVFIKKEGSKLLTKNTAISAHHQGSGYNHQIKDFFELKARALNCKEIHHFCRIDNFRMYSLNESHGYKKLDKKIGKDGQVVEWIKELK